MTDGDLKLWQEITMSAEAVLKLMKGRVFSGAIGIRNHARFVHARAGLKVSVEESRRTFKEAMTREKRKHLESK